MKLALFTPVSVNSAIAKTSWLIERALLELGHETTIIRTESSKHIHDSALLFKAKIHRHVDTHTVLDQLTDCDALVYQVGDNFDYHEGSVKWLEHHPGIVCLHDFFLFSLFENWAAKDIEKKNRIITSWYGSDVLENLLDRYASKGEQLQSLMRNAPMTEWICSQASGVITHSAWAIERVMTSCSGPVYEVPLPFEPAPAAAPEQISDGLELRLLTMGHVNENKRSDAVIQAIASSGALRKNVTYDIVGQVTEEVSEKLVNLAKRLNVKVKVHGRVTEEELLRHIASADISVCLRWPPLEAASGSTIQSLLNGKATLVTNEGFYQTLPNECVIKIDPRDEIGQLRSALERLFHSPVERRNLGIKARAWAENTFNAKNYAHAIIKISGAVPLTSCINKACNHYAKILTEWGGISNSPILTDIQEGLKLGQ